MRDALPKWRNLTQTTEDKKVTGSAVRKTQALMRITAAFCFSMRVFLQYNCYMGDRLLC